MFRRTLRGPRALVESETAGPPDVPLGRTRCEGSHALGHVVAAYQMRGHGGCVSFSSE